MFLLKCSYLSSRDVTVFGSGASAVRPIPRLLVGANLLPWPDSPGSASHFRGAGGRSWLRSPARSKVARAPTACPRETGAGPGFSIQGADLPESRFVLLGSQPHLVRCVPGVFSGFRCGLSPEPTVRFPARPGDAIPIQRKATGKGYRQFTKWYSAGSIPQMRAVGTWQRVRFAIFSGRSVKMLRLS